MNTKKFAAGLLGGVALALLASVGSASADILILNVFDRGANPAPLIPGLLDLGTDATGNRLVSTSGTTVDGVTTAFTSGSGATSGEYAGGVSNIAASPYGDLNANTNYLVAGGDGGSVTLSYSTAQSSLNILWGTVDTGDTRNLLTLLLGNTVITGSEVFAAANLSCGNCITDGNGEVYLSITNIPSFTTATFSDANDNSFEFNVGTPSMTAPVPELSTWGMMIAGFLGLGFLGYRRSARSSDTSFRMA